MSIKNIIQQENDLQEMSTQSLANYLNNPTGQYNPYLVAGELQRKEAFAQRQMTEAPQGTVVDELVAKTMPMGGMPMGGMPQMPQPRPEEMVSESITETGIANLPAPNIGQNYADGGIVGYAEGTLVGEDEEKIKFEEPILPQNVPGFYKEYDELGQGKSFEEYKAEEKAVRPHSQDGLFMKTKDFPYFGLSSQENKIERLQENFASPYKEKINSLLLQMKRASIGSKEYNDLRDEYRALNQQEELFFKNSSDAQVGQNQLRAAKAAEEAEARGLAALKASENKANSRAERDAYLALAMGGAKTMAGQSPFALTNIGEGLGAGIGALSQSDANERARVDAQRTAYEKYMYDMNADQRLSGKEYADLITDIQASDDYRFLLEQKAEGKNIDKDDPKYQVLIQETIRELLPLYGNSGASNSTTVNGKPFSRV